MCNVLIFSPSFGVQAGRGNDTGYDTKTQLLLMRLLFTFLLFYSVVCAAVTRTHSAPKTTREANRVRKNISIHPELTKPVSSPDLAFTDFLFCHSIVAENAAVKALRTDVVISVCPFMPEA